MAKSATFTPIISQTSLFDAPRQQGFSFVFTPACGWAINESSNNRSEQVSNSAAEHMPINRPNIRLTTLGFETQGTVPPLISPSAHVINQSMFNPSTESECCTEFDDIQYSECDLLLSPDQSTNSVTSDGEEEAELVLINRSARQLMTPQPLSILISPLPYKLNRRPLPPSPYYPDSDDDTQESTAADVSHKQLKNRSSNIPYSVVRSNRPPPHSSHHTPARQSHNATISRSINQSINQSANPIIVKITAQPPPPFPCSSVPIDQSIKQTIDEPVSCHRPLVVSKRSLSQGGQPLQAVQQSAYQPELSQLRDRALSHWSKQTSPWKRFKTDEKPYVRKSHQSNQQSLNLLNNQSNNQSIDQSSDLSCDSTELAINDDELVNQSNVQTDSPVVTLVRSCSDSVSHLKNAARSINQSTTPSLSAKRTRSGVIKQGQRRIFDFFAKEDAASTK